MNRRRYPWTTVVVLCLAGSRVDAQATTEKTVEPCDGRIITRIDILNYLRRKLG